MERYYNFSRCRTTLYIDYCRYNSSSIYYYCTNFLPFNRRTVHLDIVPRMAGDNTCQRDNFRFHTPIYTIFDFVMHTTIASDELEED